MSISPAPAACCKSSELKPDLVHWTRLFAKFSINASPRVITSCFGLFIRHFKKQYVCFLTSEASPLEYLILLCHGEKKLLGKLNLNLRILGMSVWKGNCGLWAVRRIRIS